MSHQPKDFRSDIEGLRAVAILAVIAFHAALPGCLGGFVGVDVFLVLSGYLITRILVREVDQTGSISLARFWARRVRRLLPAAAVVLVATAIASAIWMPPLERASTSAGIALSSLYGVNWLFAGQALDYLAANHAPNPVLHFWSLAVEEQFYLVWPFLVIFLARGDEKQRSRRLLRGMLAVWVLSFAAALVMTAVAQPLAFFTSPARFWQLGTGALLAIGSGTVARLSQPAREGLAIGGLLLILGSVTGLPWLQNQGFGYPGVIALLPTLGTAALLAAGEGGHSMTGRALAIAPLRFVGRLSYSWYLWHWGVLALWQAVYGPVDWPTKLALVTATLPVAWLSYHLIENPVRFSPRLKGNNGASLRLGLALTVVGLLAAVGLWRFDATVVEPQLVASGAITYQPTASQARKERGRPSKDGCQLKWGKTALKPCAYGAIDAKRTIYLVGDSHAGNVFEGLDAAAKETGWRLVVRSKSMCTIADIDLFNPKRKQIDTACKAWRDGVLADIAKTRPAKVVFMDSAWSYFERVVGSVGDAKAGRAQWVAGLTRTLRAAQGHSEVTVIHDTPRAPYNVATCVSKTPTTPGECDFPRVNAVDALPGEAEAAHAAGVRSADLADAICDAKTCPVVIDGVLVYADVGHLTAKFQAALAPRLIKALGL